MKGKATVKIDKVLGSAAGVNEDGTPVVTAYEHVRRLYQKQLEHARKQKSYYIAEEKRLVEILESYPLPGQIPLIKLEDEEE